MVLKVHEYIPSRPAVPPPPSLPPCHKRSPLVVCCHGRHANTASEAQYPDVCHICSRHQFTESISQAPEALIN